MKYMPKFFFQDNPNAKINTEITLNDQQDYWRKHTYRRFALMKESRAQDGRETKWDNHQKQYEAWRPPKGMQWQSNIVPPFTTSVVESGLSELIDQTLQPRVQARKRIDVPAATVINFIKDYTWEIGDGDIELYKSIKQALTLGTTFWQDYYWQEKRKVKIIVKYNPETGLEEYEEKEIFDFDDCYGESVNIWDLWFDPQARSVNIGPYKAADVIRRYIMHIDTFRNTFMNTRWDKYGFVKNIKPGGDPNYYQFYKPPQGIDHGSYVEVLWHWIRTPDILNIVANDIPFYNGPNPYNHKQLPFGRGVDLLDPWSIYGKGEPELLESIQDELTTTRRMRLDRQKLDIYKMIFVSNRETLTDQDLIPAPMKPIYVDDVANVQEFKTSDVNPSAFREEILLKEDAIRVTGIDDRFQSVPKTAGTATEAAILKESTLKRLRMKIWIMSRTLLMEQIRLRVPNIIQFYKTPKVSKIVGRDPIDKWMQVRNVAEEGRLINQNGDFYEQEYRTIVTKNKKLEKQPNGEVTVLDSRGDNFFMVTPDVLVPSEMGFNYKLSAEPTFPLSKPLQQQKINELFQHPVMLRSIELGYYDPTKISDKMLEINDFDPDDFLTKESEAPQGIPELDPARMIRMAQRENEGLMDGDELPGTPYATPEHTMAHIEFMKSDEFKQNATPNIIQNFTNHVYFEYGAQELRTEGLKMQGQGGGPGGGATPQLGAGGESMRTREVRGIEGGEAKATMPARAQGPEMTPDLAGFRG